MLETIKLVKTNYVPLQLKQLVFKYRISFPSPFGITYTLWLKLYLSICIVLFTGMFVFMLVLSMFMFLVALV